MYFVKCVSIIVLYCLKKAPQERNKLFIVWLSALRVETLLQSFVHLKVAWITCLQISMTIVWQSRVEIEHYSNP